MPTRQIRWLPEAASGLLGRVLALEAAAGGTILLGIVLAVLWSLADPAGYVGVVEHSLLPNALDGALGTTHELVTSGLMTVFFLAIGLEVARERREGSLGERRGVLLPVAAALGGMAGAALAYLVVAAGIGDAGIQGWGTPMATDVAFTLGVLALVAKGLPSSLRVLLLAIAIADDVASVVVLAVVSGRHPSLGWLAASVAVLAVCIWVSRRRAFNTLGLLGCCVAVWVGFAMAGIEPPLAGAFVGAAVACRTPGSIESVCTPVSTWVVLPLFALVSCGITDTSQINSGHARTVLIAVLIARIVGKPLGIMLGIGAAAIAGVRAPAELRTSHLVGGALLCGIGITVPLLFASSAFGIGTARYEASLIALLGASMVTALLGMAVLLLARRRASVA